MANPGIFSGSRFETLDIFYNIPLASSLGTSMTRIREMQAIR